MVSNAASKPENLAESHISHDEMLDEISDDIYTKFRECHGYVPDIDINSKKFTDQRGKHMGKDEKPVTAADNPLNVPSDMEADIRNMIWRHEHMWSGQLGEVNITEMWIDLVPDAKPFKLISVETGRKHGNLNKLRSVNSLKLQWSNQLCRNG